MKDSRMQIVRPAGVLQSQGIEGQQLALAGFEHQRPLTRSLE
jgi:hypothetical protein